MLSAARLAKYRSVQVTTCTPIQLLVMLYDGIFRFTCEAKVAMTNGDRARAGERIGRAHAILDELAATLDHKVAPDLCANLQSLYIFCMGRLIESNARQDTTMLDEVLRVLAPLRESWTAISKVETRVA